MSLRLSLSAAIVAVVAAYIGYLKISNARLRKQVEHERTRRVRDVAEAHVEEIDLTLADRLKNIEEEYREKNISVDVAGDDGVWVDDFGM